MEIERIKREEMTKANQDVIDAHEFLLSFLNKFHEAKRGGIHDFMEISLFNMINHSIKKLDEYLSTGHKSVNGNEIIAIVVDSYQSVLDGIKKNLDAMGQVNFH